jgi:hypothetical protein
MSKTESETGKLISDKVAAAVVAVLW